MVFTALTQHTLEENLKAIKERCFITMGGGANKKYSPLNPGTLMLIQKSKYNLSEQQLLN